MGVLPALFYLFLALAALAMAGGLLVWVIRYAGRKDNRNPGGNPGAPAKATPQPTGEQELLRVSRTQKGNLAISVQGRRYRHLREITDPQLGRETVEAIKAVMAFAEGWLPGSRQPSPQTTPQPRALDEEAFLERLRQADLFSTGRPAKTAVVEPLIPVEAINDLVQKRLEERQDLAERHVCLTTEADGSLRIYVGPQTFESVDEIPEPEVRTLIQGAIREWEGGYPNTAEY